MVSQQVEVERVEVPVTDIPIAHWTYPRRGSRARGPLNGSSRGRREVPGVATTDVEVVAPAIQHLDGGLVRHREKDSQNGVAASPTHSQSVAVLPAPSEQLSSCAYYRRRRDHDFRRSGRCRPTSSLALRVRCPARFLPPRHLRTWRNCGAPGFNFDRSFTPEVGCFARRPFPTGYRGCGSPPATLTPEEIEHSCAVLCGILEERP
jgi:hypothetical protein